AAAAPSLLASLGTTGLLAGGGLLGGLVGGRSQIGQLLGGVGGSLLGGFAGASIFGPGLLSAFFSNPITAIIGGGLLLGAFLSRFFGKGDFKRFRDLVSKEYQLKVRDNKLGQELFQQEKSLGEQIFGKKQFAQHFLARMTDTIHDKRG